MAILIVYDPFLALLSFAVLPFVIVGSVVFGSRRRMRTGGPVRRSARSARSCRRCSPACAWCARSGREDRHLARYGELNEENRQANLATVHLNAAYFPAIEFASSLATVLVLGVGAWR